MANPFDQFQQVNNAFDKFSPTGKPGQPEPVDYGIDYAQPLETVRKLISGLPETDRQEANKQWAKNYVQRERKEGGIGQAITDTARNLARGTIVGGWADEANAMTQDLMWKTGIGGSPYDEALAYQRATDAAIEKDHPIASTVTQMVGGVASGAPLFLKPAATVLGNVIRGVPYGAAYGYSSGFSNAEGGEGTLSEQIGQRNQAGSKAAGIGAMIGPIVPLATAGVQRGVGMAMDAAAPRLAQWRQGTPEAAADKIIARKIDQSGRTPQDVIDDLAQGQRMAELGPGSRAQLPEVIGDTTDSLRRLSGTIYRQGGKGAEEVKTALDTRQRGPDNPYAPRENDLPQGQLERVLDGLERAMEIKSSKAARKTEQQMLDEQKKLGDELYGKARDQSEAFDLDPVITSMGIKSLDYPPPFQAKLKEAMDLFTRPSNPKAAEREQAVIERMRRLQEDENRMIERARSDKDSGTLAKSLRRIREDYAVKQQRAMEDLTRIRFQDDVLAAKRFPVDDVKRFDASKQALDDIIEKAEGNLKRELVQFKHDLLARVHEYDGKGLPTKNRIYQDARDTWATRAENLDAIDLGRKALSDGSEITAEQFASLTKGQQKLARIGLRESIYKDKLGQKSPGDDVTRVFQKRDVQELMREMIPTPKGRDAEFADRPVRFGELMSRESRMVQHRNEAMGNSKTQQRGMDDAENAANTLGEMWNKFRGSPTLTNMAYEAVASVLKRVTAYRSDVAEAMARKLVQSDPADQVRYLNELKGALGKSKFEQLVQQMDESAFAIGRSIETQAGQAAARVENKARKPEDSGAKSTDAKAPLRVTVTPPGEEARYISQARNAILRGADNAQVQDRLRSLGIDPGKL